jgi:hypothetical protein
MLQMESDIMLSAHRNPAKPWHEGKTVGLLCTSSHVILPNLVQRASNPTYDNSDHGQPVFIFFYPAVYDIKVQ